MDFQVKILGQDGFCVGPCVLLATMKQGITKPMYLFGAPEGERAATGHLSVGLARLALEHRLLRPSTGRIRSVFLRDANPSTVAGLPALILR
jgi:hypothetical protein